MKKAKIVKIVFEEGEYGLTQGHKAFEKPHYRNGRYVNPTGCGYAIESRPSHLIAYLDVKGTVYDTRLDIYFRSAWGRLTDKLIWKYILRYRYRRYGCVVPKSKEI